MVLPEERKRIILIRHAESLNNVAKNETRKAWENIRALRCLPSLEQISLAGSLLTIPMNTDLSRDGELMVESLRSRLIALNVIAEHGVELIIHSHLTRAARTCAILFGDSGITIEEHPMVFEKNILEHVGLKDMKNRIRIFVQWLLARPEQSIAIVGHSAFFRELLHTDINMQNCEVRECYLTPSGQIEDMRVIMDGGDSLLTGA